MDELDTFRPTTALVVVYYAYPATTFTYYFVSMSIAFYFLKISKSRKHKVS